MGASRKANVLELIDDLEVLQTSTVVPMRILHLRRSKSAGIDDFAQLVEMDPCLCTKVLSLANSAWFAPPQPVTRVAVAIKMIGLNNLLPLLFGVSLAGVFTKLGLPPTENRELWNSSLLKAIAAREVVSSRGGELAEEAFICGLLQDVALPVMYAADPACWGRVQSALKLDSHQRAEVERQLFGFDHATIGQRLVQKMAMPVLYVAATGAHHDTERLRRLVKHGPLCEAIEFAAAVPHRMSEWKRMRAERLRELFSRGGEAANDGLVSMLQRINEKHQQIQVMLGEHDVESQAFKGFLQEVIREIAGSIERTIGESATTITRLRGRENALLKRMKGLEAQARESDYDELTRIFNRRGFIASMDRIISVAREYRFGCGVGYLDLDNFKQVNDGHGHAAGDAVLKAVAQLLREVIGERGSVGRIGGDEFVFTVVTRDQDAAMEMARQLTERLRGLEVAVPDHSAVTASGSVGMLWVQTPSDQGAADLLQKADALMYQAKKGGKGRLLSGELNCLIDEAAAPVMPTGAAA